MTTDGGANKIPNKNSSRDRLSKIDIASASKVSSGLEGLSLDLSSLSSNVFDFQSALKNIAFPANYSLGDLRLTNALLGGSPEITRLEDTIAKLKKENGRLAQEIVEKNKDKLDYAAEVEKLRKNTEELTSKQNLHYLLSRVNSSAQGLLLGTGKASKEFNKLFEESKVCKAVIMSIDIRRSTDLMLKARTPQLYADFIIGLCSELITIMRDNNYGIFDKFTGDGILGFFPDFYSGEDALYWALKAADEAHSCFSRNYEGKRNCFKSILMDVGLGIGIDYGDVTLVNMQDGLSAIGEPVVYACRLSGAEAGQTLLNQPAYETASSKFGGHVDFQETEIDIKHQGRTLAYLATLSRKTYVASPPDWMQKTSPSAS